MELHWVKRKSRKRFCLQELLCYQGSESYNTVIADLLPPRLGAEVSNREDQRYNQDGGRT